MTDPNKQKLRDQRILDVVCDQRNRALNDVAALAAQIAVLEAELVESRAEIEALKLPKPKGK